MALLGFHVVLQAATQHGILVMPVAKVPETEWKEKLVNQNSVNRKKVQEKKNDKDWTVWEQKTLNVMFQKQYFLSTSYMHRTLNSSV